MLSNTILFAIIQLILCMKGGRKMTHVAVKNGNLDGALRKFK